MAEAVKRPSGVVLKDWDIELQERKWREQQLRQAAYHQQFWPLRIRELKFGTGWYQRYLQSPQWLARRDLVLKRANGLCERNCGNGAIEVHHLTYKNVGNEPLTDLIAVCRACHLQAHYGE